jgi:ATP-dependent DNA helicase RecG
MDTGLMTPVTQLRSVGARAAARLNKLGIRTARHLLWHLPSRYEDYSKNVPINQVVPGEKQSIKGQVINIASRFIWPKRMSITTATIQDDSGAIRAVWFNQPYLEDSLPEGTSVSLAGKVVLDKRGLYLSNPVHEKVGGEPVGEGPELRHTGRLVPIYPETEGMTSKYLRFLISGLLDNLELADHLPATLRRQYGLTDLAEAVRTVHYPRSIEEVDGAKQRLAFDDVLLLQLQALAQRRLVNLQRSPAVAMDAAYMRTLVAALPFTLTRDQRVAALEVLRDMERPFPMNRLLEGDVGSGKTAVAILAALHAAKTGWQTVILAPTEVLALQHYRTLQELTKSMAGIRTALVTGAAATIDGRTVSKAQVKRAIATGATTVTIGTHALLQDDVRMPNLALVVIDEQHRFGIAQRAALMKSTRHRSGMVPHLLSMTATPIPRTLALTMFGDLDISIIREKPKGREPIQTRVVTAGKRVEVYNFIREQVAQGRQVFIICPRIEVTPIAMNDTKPEAGRKRQTKLNPLWADVKAVEDEYERLRRDIFPDLKLTMLHGRMKSKEKERVMREFKEGWHDILISTSVVEVGVDVPNASVMVIEGADRFGLAQLHQFRGRVGRAEHQSYCFLLATDDGIASRRLDALAKTNDGFKLAETDMKLRGPGEFFGLKQSGMSDLTMTALADVELIKKARLAARAITKTDPDLKRYPLLKEQLESFRSLTHSE